LTSWASALAAPGNHAAWPRGSRQHALWPAALGGDRFRVRQHLDRRDVYLEAAYRLGVDAAAYAAVEDSTNGLRAAAAAGMVVIALPNRDVPPDRDSVALAGAVLTSLDVVPRAALLRLVGSEPGKGAGTLDR
jgi:hypothetical protein